MVKDIHPRSPIKTLDRNFSGEELEKVFPLALVSSLVGMSPSYVRKALLTQKEKVNREVSLKGVLFLLDLDAFAETFIPRSQIPQYLLGLSSKVPTEQINLAEDYVFIKGSTTDLLPRIPAQSVQCVITSTPYWGLRLYNEHHLVEWADGEVSALGHEQTPEGFIRHTVQLLYMLKPALKKTASVWWNIMDSYNTRTQIRGNAAETLRAMRGEDKRGWHDHACRRYSAGHSYLKDGEQSVIPARIAERASRIGYYIKSIITWKKNGSTPEPTDTRVTRELEYILHLTVDRTPYFNKAAYLNTPVNLGGRNDRGESEKITDVWFLRTSEGKEGHGAQFPPELPGRCIVLSSNENDLVLDPFIGAGTTAVVARQLNRRCLGFDVSDSYLQVANSKMQESTNLPPTTNAQVLPTL